MPQAGLIADLYDLAHKSVWKPCILNDLLVAHGSWVGSVLNRSCTASHTGRLEGGDLDRDLSDLSVVSYWR